MSSYRGSVIICCSKWSQLRHMMKIWWLTQSKVVTRLHCRSHQSKTSTSAWQFYFHPLPTCQCVVRDVRCYQGKLQRWSSHWLVTVCCLLEAAQHCDYLEMNCHKLNRITNWVQTSLRLSIFSSVFFKLPSRLCSPCFTTSLRGVPPVGVY